MNPREKSNYIPFITNRISTGKKKLLDVPAPKADPNLIKVKIDPLAPHKMTPEELEAHWKANRGTGAHVNPADKRSKNPSRDVDGW
jgi:hypothetical protein